MSLLKSLGPSALDVLLILFLLLGVGLWFLISKKKPDARIKYKRFFKTTIVLCSSVLLLRMFVFEVFEVPSESMVPTVLEKDVLMVQKFSHNIRMPIYRESILTTGKMKRGEIVVFYLPKDPSFYYLKRVMGVEGDEVLILNNEIYVNGKNTFIKNTDIKFEDERGGERSQGLLEQENEFNGFAFKTLQDTEEQAPRFWKIPKGYFLAIGDNRGLSSDSRDFGLVSEKWVVGTATRIVFNKQKWDRWFKSYYY